MTYKFNFDFDYGSDGYRGDWTGPQEKGTNFWIEKTKHGTNKKSRFIRLTSSYGHHFIMNDTYNNPKGTVIPATKRQTIDDFLASGRNKLISNETFGGLGTPKPDKDKKGNIVFKKKFRWTYEGFDKDGNVVFEQAFVRVGNRPNIKIQETEINLKEGKTWIPGKAEWESIHITLYDTLHSEAKPENWKEMTSGKLRLFDGCGMELEEWTLEKIHKIKTEAGELDYSCSEEVTFDIEIFYDEAKYKHAGEAKPPGHGLKPSSWNKDKS